jgi:hypothetical protein
MSAPLTHTPNAPVQPVARSDGLSVFFRHGMLSFLQVYPALTAAAKTIASGFGLDEVVAGDTGKFSILSRDSYGNVRWSLGNTDAYQVVATHLTQTVFSAAANASVPVNVTGFVEFDNRTNTHEVQFYPTVSGQYNLSVFLWTDDDLREEIYGSPYLLTIIPDETYAPYCDAYGEGLSYGVAGSVMAVDIVARDVYRNLRLVSDRGSTARKQKASVPRACPRRRPCVGRLASGVTTLVCLPDRAHPAHLQGVAHAFMEAGRHARGHVVTGSLLAKLVTSWSHCVLHAVAACVRAWPCMTTLVVSLGRWRRVFHPHHQHRCASGVFGPVRRPGERQLLVQRDALLLRHVRHGHHGH